jgi:hypothetical protein
MRKKITKLKEHFVRSLALGVAICSVVYAVDIIGVVVVGGVVVLVGGGQGTFS